MDGVLYVATLVTALGSGLVAGAFFTFSSFVMPALARLPPAQGVAAMQSINRLALTPAFMAAFLGTSLLSLVLVVWVLFLSSGEFRGPVLAGGLLYLLGSFGLTAVRNVPLNYRLEAMNPAAPDVEDDWRDFVARWSTWNHVRTLAALLASGILIVALGG